MFSVFVANFLVVLTGTKPYRDSYVGGKLSDASKLVNASRSLSGETSGCGSVRLSIWLASDLTEVQKRLPACVTIYILAVLIPQ